MVAGWVLSLHHRLDHCWRRPHRCLVRQFRRLRLGQRRLVLWRSSLLRTRGRLQVHRMVPRNPLLSAKEAQSICANGICHSDNFPATALPGQDYQQHPIARAAHWSPVDCREMSFVSRAHLYLERSTLAQAIRDAICRLEQTAGWSRLWIWLSIIFRHGNWQKRTVSAVRCFVVSSRQTSICEDKRPETAGISADVSKHCWAASRHALRNAIEAQRS